MGLLSILILIPVATGLLILLLPTTRETWARPLALLACALQLGLFAIVLVPGYDLSQTGFHWVEQFTWMEVRFSDATTFQSQYHVGLDGMGFALVGLTLLVTTIALASSGRIQQKIRSYFALMLWMEAAVVGAFASLDLLLFFVFFEFMLLPLYFLIGIWGGPRREYAAVKFFLYTFLGSVFILAAILIVHLSYRDPAATGTLHTFNILLLQDVRNIIPGSLLDQTQTIVWGGLSVRMWMFLLIMAGFAVKLPVAPLHSWLPDAHVEAPTPVSVVLAGIVLKVGGYGMIRFAVPLFPWEAVQAGRMMGVFAIFSIIYGALNAMASKDLKRLVAFSSVSHMGFVLLGIFCFNETGINGAVFQLVSHGLLSAALFLLAGVLYDRTADRTIAHYSGLTTTMPRFGMMTLVAFMASLGLPAFSGFIGELLVLSGAFSTAIPDRIELWMAFAAAGGLLLGAAYFIWAYQRMFLGVASQPAGSTLYDTRRGETLAILPLLLLSLLLGLFPQALLQYLNPFAHEWIQHVIQLMTGS